MRTPQLKLVTQGNKANSTTVFTVQKSYRLLGKLNCYMYWSKKVQGHKFPVLAITGDLRRSVKSSFRNGGLS